MTFVGKAKQKFQEIGWQRWRWRMNYSGKNGAGRAVNVLLLQSSSAQQAQLTSKQTAWTLPTLVLPLAHTPAWVVSWASRRYVPSSLPNIKRLMKRFKAPTITELNAPRRGGETWQEKSKGKESFRGHLEKVILDLSPPNTELRHNYAMVTFPLSGIAFSFPGPWEKQSSFIYLFGTLRLK